MEEPMSKPTEFDNYKNYKKRNKTNHLQKFETMPEGWCIDNTFGSPEYGYIPICNGKSLLNGGKKGLLQVLSRLKPIS
jgi:hypothetical protein